MFSVLLQLSRRAGRVATPATSRFIGTLGGSGRSAGDDSQQGGEKVSQSKSSEGDEETANDDSKASRGEVQSLEDKLYDDGAEEGDEEMDTDADFEKAAGKMERDLDEGDVYGDWLGEEGKGDGDGDASSVNAEDVGEATPWSPSVRPPSTRSIEEELNDINLNMLAADDPRMSTYRFLTGKRRHDMPGYSEVYNKVSDAHFGVALEHEKELYDKAGYVFPPKRQSLQSEEKESESASVVAELQQALSERVERLQTIDDTLHKRIRVSMGRDAALEFMRKSRQLIADGYHPFLESSSVRDLKDALESLETLLEKKEVALKEFTSLTWPWQFASSISVSNMEDDYLRRYDVHVDEAPDEYVTAMDRTLGEVLPMENSYERSLGLMDEFGNVKEPK